MYAASFSPAPRTANDFNCLGIEPPPALLQAVPKRQTEFLAGRLCARAALAAVSGYAQTPLVGEDRAPIWPKGFCGSITHSNGWAVAVAAPTERYQSIGLDAEVLLPLQRSSRLANEILTAHERQNAKAETTHYITAIFSLKESLFKALYPLTGIRFYFQDAEVIEWDSTGQATLRLLKTLSPMWKEGQQIMAQHALEGTHILSMVSVPLEATIKKRS
jgi:enterobactin synthetase component D